MTVSGYTRRNHVWQSVFAPVALSSDPVSPRLFGGTASNLFVAFDSNLDSVYEKTKPSAVVGYVSRNARSRFSFAASRVNQQHGN